MSETVNRAVPARPAGRGAGGRGRRRDRRPVRAFDTKLTGQILPGSYGTYLKWARLHRKQGPETLVKSFLGLRAPLSRTLITKGHSAVFNVFLRRLFRRFQPHRTAALCRPLSHYYDTIDIRGQRVRRRVPEQAVRVSITSHRAQLVRVTSGPAYPRFM
ncbi:hypothetical protein EVAR_65989_1 [Eumeta japonica]|uniref:Uncharacterized protein n=1 Tax=Eumeta variegata TaxID=151549 RepID=A0A4C1ZLE3_EUMVA|nr:hypothetical protein EVAR_65989_1 [Eumeta japonica]